MGNRKGIYREGKHFFGRQSEGQPYDCPNNPRMGDEQEMSVGHGLLETINFALHPRNDIQETFTPFWFAHRRVLKESAITPRVGRLHFLVGFPLPLPKALLPKGRTLFKRETRSFLALENMPRGFPAASQIA